MRHFLRTCIAVGVLLCTPAAQAGKTTPQVLQQALDLCRQLVERGTWSERDYAQITNKLAAKTETKGSRERQECASIIAAMQQMLTYLHENKNSARLVQDALSHVQNIPLVHRRIGRPRVNWEDVGGVNAYKDNLDECLAEATRIITDAKNPPAAAPAPAPSVLARLATAVGVGGQPVQPAEDEGTQPVAAESAPAPAPPSGPVFGPEPPPAEDAPDVLQNFLSRAAQVPQTLFDHGERFMHTVYAQLMRNNTTPPTGAQTVVVEPSPLPALPPTTAPVPAPVPLPAPPADTMGTQALVVAAPAEEGWVLPNGVRFAVPAEVQAFMANLRQQNMQAAAYPAPATSDAPASLPEQPLMIVDGPNGPLLMVPTSNSSAAGQFQPQGAVVPPRFEAGSSSQEEQRGAEAAGAKGTSAKMRAVQVLVVILVLNFFYKWYQGETKDSWLGKLCRTTGRGVKKVFSIIGSVLRPDAPPHDDEQLLQDGAGEARVVEVSEDD